MKALKFACFGFSATQMIYRITIICRSSPWKATLVAEFGGRGKKACIALYINETTTNQKRTNEVGSY